MSPIMMTCGKLPRIAEYSDAIGKEFPSIDTVIRKERRTNDYGRTQEWTLSHRTAGYTPAGSCLRLQERDVYQVTAFIDNATHGQAFLTLQEAEQWLNARGELV